MRYRPVFLPNIYPDLGVPRACIAITAPIQVWRLKITICKNITANGQMAER